MAKSLATLAEMSRRSAHSKKWFDKATLEWWNTILYPTTFDGGEDVTLFITSEAMEAGNPATAPAQHRHRFRRMFTIRYCQANGEIDNVGSFMGYGTRKKAMGVAEQVATWWRTDTGPDEIVLAAWLADQESVR